MGELTPLGHAIASVVGLAQAEHQRRIAARLRARADELIMSGERNAIDRADAVTLFAAELEAELAQAE